MLTVYRRHKRECKSGHPHELRTSEFDERKKGFKRCACPIFASGTLAGISRRQTTGQWEWEAARRIAAEWDARGSWESTPEPPATVALPADFAAQRITIDKAIKAFSAEYTATAAPNTQKKYRILLKKLQGFADLRGYIMIDQWTPIDVRDLRAAWEVSPQTAAKNMSTIKTFFEFCLANEWITRNPARLVKRQRTRDAADKRNEQKLPFSDEELKRMYDACETQYGKQQIAWSRTVHHHAVQGDTNRYNRKWTGEDLVDFISVSIYTGLRISDVSTFHIARMLPTGEIRLRTTKAGTHVYTWVPQWLQDRIRARAEEIGPYIFGEHMTKDLNVITDVWRRKLNKLWSACGEWAARPTPHRFRHTFARILLQRPGVTVRDVAELLGNSEEMVRKHYAAWIPERQARLTKVLQDAFDDKPKPKLVEMASPR